MMLQFQAIRLGAFIYITKRDLSRYDAFWGFSQVVKQIPV